MKNTKALRRAIEREEKRREIKRKRERQINDFIMGAVGLIGAWAFTAYICISSFGLPF